MIEPRLAAAIEVARERRKELGPPPPLTPEQVRAIANLRD